MNTNTHFSEQDVTLLRRFFTVHPNGIAVARSTVQIRVCPEGNGAHRIDIYFPSGSIAFAGTIVHEEES